MYIYVLCIKIVKELLLQLPMHTVVHGTIETENIKVAYICLI